MAQLVTERPDEALKGGAGLQWLRDGGEGGGLLPQTCFPLLLREGMTRVPRHTSCPYALYTGCRRKQAAPCLAPQ